MNARWSVCFSCFVFLAANAVAQLSGDETPSRRGERSVESASVLVLSTMLADRGIGEWGFAALVEVDGRKLLFDTGARPRTVLENARELRVDLSDVEDVVLSHNHGDHTGGFITLRTELAKRNPKALSRVHVGEGIFLSRPGGGRENNTMLRIREEYEKTGGEFIVHGRPYEWAPGVWLTGPVPRVHPERNWSGRGRIQKPDGLEEDTIPESMSLVMETQRGLVVLSGCGHAGIINILEHAKREIRNTKVHAVLGGFHLFSADDTTLEWTARKLREFGLTYFRGSHCTGIEAVYRIREDAGLDRATCVVGAVGSSFELGGGIDPVRIAR